MKVLLAPVPQVRRREEQSWLVCGKGEPCLGLPLLLAQEHGPPSSALHFVQGWNSQPSRPFPGLFGGALYHRACKSCDKEDTKVKKWGPLGKAGTRLVATGTRPLVVGYGEGDIVLVSGAEGQDLDLG